jgi:hypothetical protein
MAQSGTQRTSALGEVPTDLNFLALAAMSQRQSKMVGAIVLNRPISMIRTAVVVTAILGSGVPGAQAGDVRHPTIPQTAWGTWAVKPDLCGSDDSSLLHIKEGGGAGPESDCTVEYVVETAGAKGPIYSAHMWCTDKADPNKKGSKTFLVIPRGDDSMSVGTAFDDLKSYVRCPATR